MLLRSLGVAAAVLSGCARGMAVPSSTAPRGNVIAIVHVSVIPMDTDRVIPDAAVIVRGDRIAWVGSMRDARIPADAERVDGRGAFVLPGLADLHVHTEERDLPLYVQNGVTTIRELNGSPVHLAMRDRVRRGELAGPTIHVAGTLLAGVAQPWRHRLITTVEQGRSAVREQADSGYEFIKVYDGLSTDSYAAIVDEARRHHVRVIGHVPAAVGLGGVLAARQDEIEHVDQIVRGIIYRDTTRWRERVDSVAREIARVGTWVNPTLSVEEGLARAGTAWYAARLTSPEMRFVDSSTMAWWSSLNRPRRADSAHAMPGASADDDYPSPRSRAVVAIKRATVASFQAHGVRMLLGTDLPNPLMVPGYAVHEELAALVRAGLAPFDAIATGTRDAGRFMGGDPFGTIAPGSRADLIIVAGNPLQDVARLRHPRAVLVRGAWARRLDN